MSWVDDERTQLQLRREVARLGRRARRRPWLTGALGLSLSAAVLAIQVRRSTTYTTTVRLLLTEGGGAGAGSAARPRREVRSFVTDLAFTNGRLEQLIARHSLGPELGAPGSPLAVTRMRQRIEVEVSDDYFLERRYQGWGPRSARILVSFTATRPELALAVARDLGALVVEEEAAGQLATMEHQLAQARMQVQAERRALVVATAGGSAADAGGGSLRALLDRSRSAQQATARELRLHEGEAQVEEIRLRLEATRHQLGPRVQVIDAGQAPERGLTRAARQGRQVALSLLVCLPLAVALVGAYDRRIYDLEDVRRAGYQAIAQLGRGNASS